ncbi:MAG: uracil-DNA glycosylase [Chitinophagales bacterium]|nr:uracil-DNA glycosylase [Chitinophagales bacterium]
MKEPQIQIEDSWKKVLMDEFQQPYFSEIKKYLQNEKAAGHVIYPPGPFIFNAFNLTPFDKVKVVILGQDPYHGPGQAHGLSFSVPDGITPPPSLANIFKEIHNDLHLPIPKSGNLTAWAHQGVMLLNALLTVRAKNAASHHNIGWEKFTNAVINSISTQRSGIVFLLWGRFAQEKEALIDTGRHHVLKAAHPSPFSADKFFGCKHFSKTNEILKRQKQNPIDWGID